jgi:hypothetical protein
MDFKGKQLFQNIYILIIFKKDKFDRLSLTLEQRK